MTAKRVGPVFTDEHRKVLLDLLRPRCCHVSGMHNPTHFQENPARFCESQKAEAWERVVAALKMQKEIGPATSDPECGWCSDARKQAARERDTARLATLDKVIARVLTVAREGRSKEMTLEAEHAGGRYVVSFSRDVSIKNDRALAGFSMHHIINVQRPKFDPRAAIPEDGYPRAARNLTEDDAAEIGAVIQAAGAQIAQKWGTGEWWSYALAR